MLTTCPACATVFRVSSAQLKARAGKVRCGQCSVVFNALDNLLEQLPAAPPSAEPPPEAAAGGEAAEALDMAPGSAATEPEPEPVAEKPPVAAIPEADATTASDDYLPDALLHEPEHATRRWPWVLGSIVAACGLLLQVVYYYRVELAVLRPDLRPLLQAACKPLGCEVPRPRHIETLSIDTSDLRPDPLRPSHLTLAATLRSKAPFAQEWPLLEFTLTDVADRKLAVKHFAASDYLPKDKDSGSIIAAGFPASGEITVTLPIDVGDLPAAGYRLYIFYP